MTNHEDNRQERDDLDRTLDAALAKYASVEPREGLEERILANLQAAGMRAAQRTLWSWGFAVVAAVLLVVTFVWRSRMPSQPAIANHPTSTEHRSAGSENEAHHQANVVPRRLRPANRAHAPGSAPVLATAPKLDQFPSPHPLSEQERLLADYVANDPHQAVLIARAQAEVEQRDHEEEMREMNAASRHDSEQTRQ